MNEIKKLDKKTTKQFLDNTKNTIALLDAERQRCEVWTRVMGYHRPVSSFNIGKKSEHRERIHFREDKVALLKNTEAKTNEQ